MGAIDTEFKRLHDVVTSLEDRVKRLEQRQSGEPLTAESIRMILIGPPGAGTSPSSAFGAWLRQVYRASVPRYFGSTARIVLTGSLRLQERAHRHPR